MKTDTKEVFKHMSAGQKLIVVSAIAALVFVILIGVIMWMGGKLDHVDKMNDELVKQLEEAEKIDVTYVGNKLESISELTTAKMTYNGIIHFTEGDIPLINKKEFHMAYRVSIKAGFDLSQAKITVSDQVVTIILPEAEIYEPVVDETSIQFFDKSFGLFVHEEMDDLSAAVTQAKEDALAQPETEEMKQTAENQAVILITALFEGQLGQRELVVNAG